MSVDKLLYSAIENKYRIGLALLSAESKYTYIYSTWCYLRILDVYIDLLLLNIISGFLSWYYVF